MKPIRPYKKNYATAIYIIIGLVITLGLSLYYYSTLEEEDFSVSIYSYSNLIEQPEFSHASGIYDAPFQLQLSAPEGYEVYYTTDGSKPTVESIKYTEEIRIDPQVNPNDQILKIPTSPIWRSPYGKQNHAVVIRAIGYKKGKGYSKPKNAIFYERKNFDHDGFQVIHILTDNDNLFSGERGLYVMGEKYYSKKELIENPKVLKSKWWTYPANYHERGRKWEREADLVVLNSEGQISLNQEIGLRINGNNTRAYPQKSLRLIAHKRYGNETIDYPFFPDGKNQHRKLILRNSGNDWDRTLFRDALMQELAKGIKVELQNYAPGVVYINGNYWGIHNIRERLDDDYLVTKYDTHEDNFVILDSKYDVYHGNNTSNKPFKEFMQYVQKNSLTAPEAYEYISGKIDLNSFIDFIVVETFFVNTDWPSNNMKFYRFFEENETMKEAGVEAGKWRWMIFDLDYGFNYTHPTAHQTNMFKHLRKSNVFVSTLFFKLMENKAFKNQFAQRYEELVHSHFYTDRILDKIDKKENLYEKEITRQIARWRKPGTKDKWRNEIEKMREFARQRPDIVLRHLEELVSEDSEI